MQLHEADCYRSLLEGREYELNLVNITYQKPSIDLFDNTDVFFVGGSGEYGEIGRAHV